MPQIYFCFRGHSLINIFLIQMNKRQEQYYESQKRFETRTDYFERMYSQSAF